MLAPLVLLLVASLALFPNSRPSPLVQPDPFAPAVLPPAEPSPLAEGELARQNGDIEAAVGSYRSLLQQGDQAVAEEARTRIAGLELGRGRLTEAAAEVEPLTASATPVVRERASFLLAEIARAGKDCASAIPRYQTLVSNHALLAPYARLGLFQCAEAAGDANSAIQHAQAVLDQQPHRRLRVEALEKLAAMEQQRGNSVRSLEIYDELYSLGASRMYRGTVLFTSAGVARTSGNIDLAVRKLSTLVREYPEHTRALAALDLLNALQESSSVTWTQAALVRLNAGQLDAARAGFDAALDEAPDGPEAAMAQYHRATMILRQGRETEAAREMRSAAERQPESSIAPVALFRAARIIESNGGIEDASQIYARLAAMYPDTTQGREGRFRLGLLKYVRGDRAGAIDAWEPLAQDGAERGLQALALQWQGKAYREMGNRAEGDTRLQRAQRVGPDTFGGMRAGAIERGEARIQHTFQGLSTPVNGGWEADPDIDDWLASMGTSQAALQDELASEPMYQRAAELSRLGLQELAGWELDGLTARARQQVHPLAHQFVLAATEKSWGHSSRALRTAESAAREHKAIRTSLPAAFQRLLMPLAFEDLLVTSSSRHNTDPLLLAAIVWQESRFEPSARSPANALGLTQVLPGTGRTIAAALGYPRFSEADLFKPSVSLDFGAYFLAHQLERYGGQILPALAAYNAGAGTVEKWLNEYGRSDMDLFAARVPYNETSHYLHVVYENYGLYKRLYGAQ